MKFLTKSIILLFLLIMITACPELGYKHYFWFSNNYTSDVFVYLGVAPRELGGSLYPDTGVAETKCGIPLGKNEFMYYSYNYEYHINDTLCLFIFDANTYNSYSWEEIKTNYMVLQRYDLSLSDFQKLNKQITYPPTEAMKEIKMYPPYGQ